MVAIIEQIEVVRDYEFRGVEAIISHPKYGFLLVADGFGYHSEFSGGAVRWEHGIAAQIKPGDSLDNMDLEKWNDGLTLKQAVLLGLDDGRPILEVSGSMLAAMVASAGL